MFSDVWTEESSPKNTNTVSVSQYASADLFSNCEINDGDWRRRTIHTCTAKDESTGRNWTLLLHDDSLWLLGLGCFTRWQVKLSPLWLDLFHRHSDCSLKRHLSIGEQLTIMRTNSANATHLLIISLTGLTSFTTCCAALLRNYRDSSDMHCALTRAAWLELYFKWRQLFFRPAATLNKITEQSVCVTSLPSAQRKVNMVVLISARLLGPVCVHAGVKKQTVAWRCEAAMITGCFEARAAG